MNHATFVMNVNAMMPFGLLICVNDGVMVCVKCRCVVHDMYTLLLFFQTGRSPHTLAKPFIAMITITFSTYFSILDSVNIFRKVCVHFAERME